MISKYKKLTIFPIILREFDAVITLFHPAKTQKMANFSGRWIQSFEVIYEEQVMAHTKKTQNMTSKHKIYTIFPLIFREVDVVKMRFSQRNAENDHFIRTLEFKILI
jgi:hypothetical protein